MQNEGAPRQRAFFAGLNDYGLVSVCGVPAAGMLGVSR